MPTGTCVRCGAKFSGWALVTTDNPRCSVCGAAIEVVRAAPNGERPADRLASVIPEQTSLPTERPVH